MWYHNIKGVQKGGENLGKGRRNFKKASDLDRKDGRKIYSKRRAGFILSVISILMCVLSIVGVIILNKLSAEYENSNLLRELIDSHPLVSAAVMVAVCALQVVIAFVPGEVVEVAAGYAFGAWWGAVLCTVGITLGSVVSIFLTRRYGRRLIETFCPAEKLDSLPILGEANKRRALVAVLFLIPGTPKDLITYIIGLTDMSIFAYILISVICRFPSIIMSTLGGDAMGEQKWVSAIWLFIITGVVSGTGYLIYLFIRRITPKGENENN